MATCAVCGESMALAAGTMTGDGLKCSKCVATPSAPAPDMFRKAGKMPGKLSALVALMGISIVLNLLTVDILGVLIGGALLFGILVGNDGVRRFVVGLAWVNLIFALARAGIALNQGGDSGLVVIVSAIAIGNAAFAIWCLTREDVRDWMFRTAFKDGL